MVMIRKFSILLGKIKWENIFYCWNSFFEGKKLFLEDCYFNGMSQESLHLAHSDTDTHTHTQTPLSLSLSFSHTHSHEHWKKDESKVNKMWVLLTGNFRGLFFCENIYFQSSYKLFYWDNLIFICIKTTKIMWPDLSCILNKRRLIFLYI